MLSRQATTSLAGLAARRSAPTSAARAFTTQSAAGIPVAAADDGAPTSAVTVAVRAGSRFESTPGAAHVLKNFLFKSTEKRSALRLVRESELYGGVLSASVSKEQLLLTAEFLRGDEDYFVEVLGDVLSSSRFLRHEFDEEVVPSVSSEYEQALLQPSTLGLDILTQTAFRHRGIGASILASPSSPVSYNDVVSFARATFSKSNIAVLGSGIESSKLASLVSNSFSEVSSSDAAASSPASKYHGGEQRVSYAAPHGSTSPKASYGHFLMAFEGAGLNKSPELAVLKALLGGESSVKWSKGISPLSKLNEKYPGLSAQAFNLNFSDTGLFGAYLTAPHDHLNGAAKDVANAIKEVASKASEEQVQAAIARAKFEAANALESRAGSHAVVGAALLNSGNVTTLDSVFSALDGVKASAVSQAAGKLLQSKPTAVAIGDVHKLPYADELV